VSYQSTGYMITESVPNQFIDHMGSADLAYYILDTDYDTFDVVYSCTNSFEFMEVWSRKKIRSIDEMQSILKRVYSLMPKYTNFMPNQFDFSPWVC
jgi:hypothetical protein